MKETYANRNTDQDSIAEITIQYDIRKNNYMKTVLTLNQLLSSMGGIYNAMLFFGKVAHSILNEPVFLSWIFSVIYLQQDKKLAK